MAAVFPYFGKHDWFNSIEDQVKGLPVHDKSNQLHSDSSIFLFVIWPQLSTPPAEAISACETKPTASSTAGKWMCTKPSVTRGEQQEEEGEKTAWIPRLAVSHT